MSDPAPSPVRHVVFHHPGPKWKPGMDFREQEGVREQVQYYLKFHREGKLVLGGPFLLQDAGGMMLFEIRPWLTAMERTRIEEP
jgi:hypothetical protein